MRYTLTWMLILMFLSGCIHTSPESILAKIHSDISINNYIDINTNIDKLNQKNYKLEKQDLVFLVEKLDYRKVSISNLVYIVSQKPMDMNPKKQCEMYKGSIYYELKSREIQSVIDNNKKYSQVMLISNRYKMQCQGANINILRSLLAMRKQAFTGKPDMNSDYDMLGRGISLWLNKDYDNAYIELSKLESTNGEISNIKEFFMDQYEKYKSYLEIVKEIKKLNIEYENQVVDLEKVLHEKNLPIDTIINNNELEIFLYVLKLSDIKKPPVSRYAGKALKIIDVISAVDSMIKTNRVNNISNRIKNTKQEASRLRNEKNIRDSSYNFQTLFSMNKEIIDDLIISLLNNESAFPNT